jgi:hypothetical protein
MPACASFTCEAHPMILSSHRAVALTQQLCVQVFPCGHYFCDACAQQQLAAASPSCPYCRKHVTKSGVFRVSLAGSGAHDPEVAPPEGPAVRDIKVWLCGLLVWLTWRQGCVVCRFACYIECTAHKQVQGKANTRRERCVCNCVCLMQPNGRALCVVARMSLRSDAPEGPAVREIKVPLGGLDCVMLA